MRTRGYNVCGLVGFPWRVIQPPNKPAKSIMIDSFWDLYVAYIAKSVRDNWNNDIDPNHYEMEWNHFLPKCVFGEWPIGQWLTLRQHAIASALQTLATGTCCLCSWHKQHLPEWLWEMCGTQYSDLARKAGNKAFEMGVGVHAPGMASKGGTKSVELGVGVHGRSAEQKAEDGRKGGKKGGKKSAELGVGVHAPGMQSEGAKTINAQKWQNTDPNHPPFITNPGNLTQWQRARGIDTSMRIKLK